MNVQIKTSAGINLIPLESKLYEYRTIFLTGEINQEMALEFAKQVMELVQQNSKEEIKVIINSPGGEINAGMVIYDIIQSTTTPIKLFCFGQAYSMAAVLFLSGQNGRYLFPNSKLMLHQPLIQTCPGGSASSVKSLSDSLLREKNKMNAIISKHTGMSLKQVAKITSHDNFFTAEESIKANMADDIVSFDAIFKGGD